MVEGLVEGCGMVKGVWEVKVRKELLRSWF